MKDRSKIYTALELLCVFFWFLLDGFWLMEWRVLAYCFSIMAVVSAIAMIFYIENNLTVVLVASADSCWLLTNILWCIGDLSHIKPALAAAKVVFGISLLICCAALHCTPANTASGCKRWCFRD